MFDKGKEEVQKSPIEQLLGAFTEQSVRINAILGFPGVLLLMAIVFVSLPSVPGVTASPGLTVLAAVSLVGGVVTYLASWYYSLRHAQSQAQMLASYTQLFLEKYLASLGEVKAQDVTFGIDHILMPLFEKRRIALPPNTPPRA